MSIITYGYLSHYNSPRTSGYCLGMWKYASPKHTTVEQTSDTELHCRWQGSDNSWAVPMLIQPWRLIILLLQEKRQTVTVREKGLLLEKIDFSYWHLQEYATRTLLCFRTFSHLLGFSPTFPICWASHSIVCCRNSPRG